MFWKNAGQPRKGSPDKNLLVDADSEQEAEAEARKHFAFATAYPWACDVHPLHIESPAAEPAEPSSAGSGEQAVAPPPAGPMPAELKRSRSRKG
jgi:hypothetical protein